MKIFGTDLMVFVGGKSVALAKNHTLEVTMNTSDTSTKDNGLGRWQDFEAALRQWTMSTENLVGDSQEQGLSIDDLMDLIISGEKVELVFALQTDIKDLLSKKDQEFKAPEGGWTPDKTNYYKGKALVTSLNIGAQNGEYATGSATFTGCSNLQKIGNGISGKAATLAAKAPAPVATAAASSGSK